MTLVNMGSFKPFAAMLALHFGYAGMNNMSRAAFTSRFSPCVFVVYMLALGNMVIGPFAYFLER